jgi:hypothetical protein
MAHRGSALCTIVAALAIGMASEIRVHAGQRADGNQKPSLAFKATPPVVFAPLKVRFTIDVRGGATITLISLRQRGGMGRYNNVRSSEDAAAEAGKSTIQRWFTPIARFARLACSRSPD